MKTESKSAPELRKFTKADPSKKGQWVRESLGVLYVVDGQVQFSDDHEHFANGILRLLEVPEEKLTELIEVWVEQSLALHKKLPSQMPMDAREECLRLAALMVFPPKADRLKELTAGANWGTDFLGTNPDTVYAGSISGNVARGVVGCSTTGFAWLVDPLEKAPVHADSIVYDTAYYDDKPAGHYGPKQYLKQLDWRMQKARRYTAHILEVSGARADKWLKNPSEASLLDVGSAIGLFRAAAAEYGLSHYGIDVSSDAIEHCKNNGFGYDSWLGSIFDIEKHAKPNQKFNIITLWDVIEHIGNHVDAFKLVDKFLADDGVIVIRTPNLECIEAAILGDMYYSYKLDHTSYFSVRSLNSLFEQVGLVPIHTATVSHMFKGCFGAQHLYDAGQRLYGADILAVYARPGSVG
ncbi:hypothetical protein BH11CYA1_BH11CYA1_33780 [soil metagenome]